MKLLIFILIYLPIISFSQHDVKRQVIYKEICDTLKLENYYKKCIPIFNKNVSLKEKEYYIKDCRKEAHKLFCFDIKGIEYSKNGKVIDFISCDSLLRQKDKKLCLE